jgi:hypothetical protein
MRSILSNQRLADELTKRDLTPRNCRLLELRVEPTGALVIRYEVFVDAPLADGIADALKTVARAASPTPESAA